MGVQEYTEAALLAKKYTDLLKISKGYGVKPSKRLKTDKLIEAILKCQWEETTTLTLSQDAEATLSLSQDAEATLPLSQDAEATLSLSQDAEATLSLSQDAEATLSLSQDAEATLSLSQDAEAVVTALNGATHTTTHHQDELLLDIQFPECESKGFMDSLDSNSDADKKVSGDTGTEQQQKQEADVSSCTQEHKTHKRSGTYNLEEEEREKGSGGSEERKTRQRPSTFDLSPSSDMTLTMEEKQTEENTKQLSALRDKVTLRGSRRRGVVTQPSLGHWALRTKVKQGHAKPAASSQEGASSSLKRRRSKTAPATKDSLLVSPWRQQQQQRVSRVSLASSAKRLRRSVTITPSAPAPPLRPSSHQRGSRGTSSSTPAPALTATTAASTTKPVFTIGRADKKEGKEATQVGKQGGQGRVESGIPRFVSYARCLKMPNFARIHERAFDRMEGLDDYVKKRSTLQDTLGSTAKKKQDQKEIFKPSLTNVKNLNFNFGEESAEEPQEGAVSQRQASHSQPQTLDMVPIMPSPKSLKKATNAPRGASARLSRSATRDALKPGKVISSLANRDMTRKSVRVSRKPSPKSAQKTCPKLPLKAPGKEGTSQKKSPKAGSAKAGLDDAWPTTAQKARPAAHQGRAAARPTASMTLSAMTLPVFGSHLKENCNPGKQCVSSPMPSNQPIPGDVPSPASVRKRMQEYSKGLASSRTAYIPYKGAVKPLKSRSDLKTLAARKHAVKSSKEIREGQKKILRGVRLNKRFELQMANRGITL